MSKNDPSTEDIKFNAYKESMTTGAKFLRSKWHSKVNSTHSVNSEVSSELTAKPLKKLKKASQKIASKQMEEVQVKEEPITQSSMPDVEIPVEKENTNDLYIKEECNVKNENCLPYEIIPSKNSLHDNIVHNDKPLFFLYDKLRYNKILPLEKFEGRFILFKSNHWENFNLAMIDNIENDTIKTILFNLTDLTPDYDIENVINLKDKRNEIYLIEGIFTDSSDSHHNNVVVVTRFPINDGFPIFLSDCNKIFYTAVTFDEDFKFSQTMAVEASQNLNVFTTHNERQWKFFNLFRNSYHDFLFKNEMVLIGVGDDTLAIEDHLMHEIYSPSLGYNLFLKFNKELNSAFVKNYRTAKCQWINLGHYQEIYVNHLKGRATISRKLNSSNFHNKIPFDVKSRSKLQEGENILLTLIKRNNKGESIMSELTCDKCTYKINQYQYSFCNFCKKIFHSDCLDPGQRNKTSSPWACLDCKPCVNCFSNKDSEEPKLLCSSCLESYHFNCINDSIRKLYPKDIRSFKCESCLKCKSCSVSVKSIIMEKTVNSLNNSFSSNLDVCYNCEKKMEKKELCPICRKLCDDKVMIECKCKFWVHKDCDRILGENFVNLSKKVYHCPKCRINTKIKQILNILNEIVVKDVQEFFFNPVDTNLVKNYTKIIKTPMCFATIQEKVKNNVYLQDIDEFAYDLELIFKNAMNFNMPNTQIYKVAQSMDGMCKQILESSGALLSNLSFDYFLFDYNPDPDELLTYFNNPLGFLNNLNQVLKEKFENKLNCVNFSIVKRKIDENNITWIDQIQVLSNFNFNLDQSANKEDEGATSKSIAKDTKKIHLIKKPKLVKMNEFTQELDLHDSNFEIKRKKITSTTAKANHKMEINDQRDLDENAESNFSPEEEESLLKAYERMRQVDSKMIYLYPNKLKLMLGSDYLGFLDILASYTASQSDKKKKVATSNKDYEDNLNKSPVKIKENKKLLSHKRERKMSEINNNDNSNSESLTNKLVKQENDTQTERVDNILVSGGVLNQTDGESTLWGHQVCFKSIDLIFEINCFQCGSFDDQKYLITCSTCSENFHSYCISSSSININLLNTYNWKCQNCKSCEKCQGNNNENVIIYCDTCDRAYHIYCLDIPLYKIPESSWKCSSCFKCNSCGTSRYYKNSFPIKKDKDYSMFTRNFTLCFECGMKGFFNSFCSKCEKSYFRNLNSNIIFISTKEDYLKFADGMTTTTDVMLNCSLCLKWYHWKCLGFDELNLKKYFESFTEFSCLDCHLNRKFPQRYMEVSYIQYLEVLKMSFFVMCLSKLVMIILKAIQSDSNIKLHSKVVKMFLKDNFDMLMSDKKMCMLIEFIRMDVFLLKDINDKEDNQIKELNKNISDLSANDHSPKSNSLGELKNISLEHIAKQALTSKRFSPIYLSKVISKYEKKKTSRNYTAIKGEKHLFSLENRSKMKKSKFLTENIDYDYHSLLNKNISSMKAESPGNEKEETKNLEHNTPNKSAHDLTRKRKLKQQRRFRLISDRKLSIELNTFVKSKNKIRARNSINMDLIQFYNFSFDDFYQPPHLKEGGKIILDIIANGEMYMKPRAFNSKIRKFLYDLIIHVIVLLKTNLFKWLMSQMLIPEVMTSTDQIELDAADFGEEEMTKSLEALDPIEESPASSLSCLLCSRKGSRKLSGRLLYISNESWVHVNCILWSKGVQISEAGEISNISPTLSKFKYYKCPLCKKIGASLNCENKKCSKCYHFSCAVMKQCVFTNNREFYCNKCHSAKEEDIISDFNSMKLYTIRKENTIVANDMKTVKFNLGLFNRFGNTTLVKLAQVNQKDFYPDTVEICLVKNLKGTKSLLVLVLIESSISLIHIDQKDFKKFLMENKFNDCFTKSSLLYLSHYKNVTNNLKFNFNINSSKFERYETVMDCLMKFEESSQAFLKQLPSQQSSLTSYLNLFQLIKTPPIRLDIIFSPQGGAYLKSVIDNENFLASIVKTAANTSVTGTDNIESKVKKEQKNKLDNFITLIKTKNQICSRYSKFTEPTCFEFLNYIESHQEMKLGKRSLIDKVEADILTGEEAKVQKQANKNLNKTMNTNFMDINIPLSMKYRNYKSTRPKVTIGPSAIHRNGLFATVNFQPGEIVIEYVGELITNKIADYREKEYNLRGFGDCYMFRLDQYQIIDATKFGNLARFINHSCDPNCLAQSNEINGSKHIILYAKRFIKMWEEITYDYNFECEEEKILCRCGAENCLGRLN